MCVFLLYDLFRVTLKMSSHIVSGWMMARSHLALSIHEDFASPTEVVDC